MAAVRPPASFPSMPQPGNPAAPPGGSASKINAKCTVETGHGDMIHDAQMDYYGRRLASCSSDRTIKIFNIDRRTGAHRLEAVLTGHDGPVWQVCWSHPTKHGGRALLASASHDGRVIIWMEEAIGTWRQIYEYSWHASSVNSVSFAPHEYGGGLTFACASSDGFVSICTQLADGTWDERRISESTDGGAHTHPLGALSVSWAPGVNPGALYMQARAKESVSKMLVTAGCDHLVKVWTFDEDKNNWTLQGKPLKGHRDMVRSVAWMPNVGLPRSVIASAGQDRKVIVWTRELLGEAKGDMSEWVATELPLFTGPVWSVSWSPTGSLLGVSSGDDGVSVWKEELDGSWRNVSHVSGSGTAGNASS